MELDLKSESLSSGLANEDLTVLWDNKLDLDETIVQEGYFFSEPSFKSSSMLYKEVKKLEESDFYLACRNCGLFLTGTFFKFNNMLLKVDLKGNILTEIKDFEGDAVNIIICVGCSSDLGYQHQVNI